MLANPTQPCLLIYQMGKVGSQTLEATLEAAELPHCIFRTHLLSRRYQKEFRLYLQSPEVPEETKASLRKQLAEARLLHAGIRLRRRWLQLRKSGRKLEIVTGVREPVSLLLAAVFQNFKDYFANLEAMTLDNCRNLLASLRSSSTPQHPLQEKSRFFHEWFDTELKGVLGIDVYSLPFSHFDGYCVMENEVARVLIYRYENFNHINGILEHFLKIKLDSLVSRNIGAHKQYGATYLGIKENLRLPEEFLTHQYSSRLAQHFYSRQEREQFKARWRN